jgi:4-aminobutyrate--pyruvate transaminase
MSGHSSRTFNGQNGGEFKLRSTDSMGTKYPLRPNSIEARDQRSVIHGLTNLKTHLECGPLIMDCGRGVWVKDAHGNEYIEGMSGLWCLSLGFGQKRLIAAATKQMETLAYYHLTNHRSHGPVIELAEKLLSISPVPMSHVWFANSGSEANDCAARIAWYYWNAVGQPDRRKFISHHRAYHGNTIATASLSGVPYAHERFNLPLGGFLHVACPDYFTGGRDGESENQFVKRLIEDIESLILREGPETIAAFFTEPILAAGGVVIPPIGYFERLRALLRKYDILLVCDEVVTAFGRTGQMFGSTTMGIEPDILVCAKALSAAYVPISAVLVNERIFDAMVDQSNDIGVFGLTMTYSGHPVAAAVACEALAIYEEMDIPRRVSRLEKAFLGGLRQQFTDHPLVGEIRGRGLLAGIQLVRQRSPLKFFPEETGAGRKWADAAERRGLLVRAIGDVIALCPPLTIEEHEITELIDRLAAALSDIEATLANPSRQ